MKHKKDIHSGIAGRSHKACFSARYDAGRSGIADRHSEKDFSWMGECS